MDGRCFDQIRTPRIAIRVFRPARYTRSLVYFKGIEKISQQMNPLIVQKLVNQLKESSSSLIIDISNLTLTLNKK